MRLVVDAVARAMGDDPTWELVLVDDGSSDGTYRRAHAAGRRDPRVRVVRLARNYGQSRATQAGFDHSSGDIVVTMDGDLQNDPRDVHVLVRKLESGYDLVAGYRERRQDRFLTRTVPSKAANLLIRWLTGVRITDNGCSLKAYRRDLVDRLGLYSEMHRFIPALAVGMAGANIAEVPVRHHPRRFGQSKYGLSRVWKVLADLMTVTMIRWFRDRPLHMFAIGALIWLGVGLAFGLGAVISRLLGGPVALVLPGAAVLTAALGIYLLMVGLIAEVALYGGLAVEPPDRQVLRPIEGVRG